MACWLAPLAPKVSLPPYTKPKNLIDEFILKSFPKGYGYVVGSPPWLPMCSFLHGADKVN